VDEEGRKQNSKFDVILLLSVVKWMHLSRGDDGLLRVFEKVSRLLEEDGCVIIELQDWKSYENAAKKNPGLRAKLEDIKVRPETFESVLSDRFGLEVVGRLGGQGETSSRKGVGKYFMLKREIWLLKRS
jgi:7SK snRNA methylphosphate capping enzyme